MEDKKKDEILDEEIKNEQVDAKDVSSEKKKDNCGCETISRCKCDEEKDTLKAEIEEWKQAYLRKQAEFQNFTKRKEKEVDELRKFASEKIITKFLGSLDNLERAVEASKETKDFDGLVEGIEMILRNLKDIITSEGVEEIKNEGECDPVYHHAVSVENHEDFKDNEIVRVLQKGYVMKGKVIRPSMVSVCKK